MSPRLNRYEGQQEPRSQHKAEATIQMNVVSIASSRPLRERGLDETLSDTFPCSDPLSSIPNPVLRPETNAS